MSDAAVSYATLILADAEIEITSDKLLALTKAAGVDVESVSRSEWESLVKFVTSSIVWIP
jgi:ribosomal protein L12E/L44/L45/RPP1/RPP2